MQSAADMKQNVEAQLVREALAISGGNRAQATAWNQSIDSMASDEGIRSVMRYKLNHKKRRLYKTGCRFLAI